MRQTSHTCFCLSTRAYSQTVVAGPLHVKSKFQQSFQGKSGKCWFILIIRWIEGSGQGITVIPSHFELLTAEQWVGFGPCPWWSVHTEREQPGWVVAGIFLAVESYGVFVTWWWPVVVIRRSESTRQTGRVHFVQQTLCGSLLLVPL